MSKTTGFLRFVRGRDRVSMWMVVFDEVWEKKRKAKAMEAARAMEVMRRRAMKRIVVEGLCWCEVVVDVVVVRRAVD